MDGFDPLTSFGPDAAAEYDDDLRGDEAAAADLLAGAHVSVYGRVG